MPSALIGRQVRVLLYASDLTVYDGRTPVSVTIACCRLDLDHYLEALILKPGALPGTTALEQAGAKGTFTTAHDGWWAAACKAHGDAEEGLAASRKLVGLCQCDA